MKYPPYRYKGYTVILETLQLVSGRWGWFATIKSQNSWRNWACTDDLDTESEAFQAAKQSAEDRIDKSGPVL
jgi:hypothetical protein